MNPLTSSLSPLNSIEKLTVYAFGFDSQNRSCHKKMLLDQLALHINGISISNVMPQDTDVLILNLDAQTIPLIEKQLPSEDHFTILIVHEVSRIIIPFLKLADHIIFINEIQQFICNDFLGLSYSSTVLPYPFGCEDEKQTDEQNCFIYLENERFSFREDYYQLRIQEAIEWYPIPDTSNYYIFLEVAPENEKKFNSFKLRLQEKNPQFCFYNSRELSFQQILGIANTCQYAHVFKEEITLEQYLNAVENYQLDILYETLGESPVLAALQYKNLKSFPSLGKSFYNFNFKKKSDYALWAETIKEIITNRYHFVREQKNAARQKIKKDTLNDLTILSGKPLANKYVFSICFRNQENKIVRCLNSILEQKGNHDFGIVLISDASDDRSLQYIIDFAQKCPIDLCIVDNVERKFASRNYYNVAHLLVTNDESVIIEVDGDDFLATDQVLNILDTYYEKGALKTNGSYKMHPPDQSFIQQKDIESHHANYNIDNPWSMQCTSWLHLRTAKNRLIRQVEIDYFLERKSKNWLVKRHDSSIQPRIIELAKGNVHFIKEILYCYDVSGENHDHETASKEELEIENYNTYDLLYHPIYLSY